MLVTQPVVNKRSSPRLDPHDRHSPGPALLPLLAHADRADRLMEGDHRGGHRSSTSLSLVQIRRGPRHTATTGRLPTGGGYRHHRRSLSTTASIGPTRCHHDNARQHRYHRADDVITRRCRYVVRPSLAIADRADPTPITAGRRDPRIPARLAFFPHGGTRPGRGVPGRWSTPQERVARQAGSGW